MKRTLTLATMIALGAAAYMPLSSVAQSSFSVVIGDAPPAPRYESVPAPRSGYIWAPGYWNWTGDRHDWVPGHWERDRRGYRYRAPEWERADRGYRLNQGDWVVISDGDVDYIRVAPPPPRHERVPRVRHGHVWEPGHWEWRRGRYEWRPGKWIAVRRGYEYRPHTWIERDGHWVLEQPRWHRPGRDRDRDGIDDRRDRDLDNDGIPNRRDADIDGDGVRNDRDARPANDRRY
ncbi:YXWGXW repeat-containing protein [Massilia cavernae]|uniref:BcpO-related WXXGXW repeat protein n=1 Tax=Massilia cavernae TaxID=2320864 RepID=A0A418Y187_9BURK|nr:YXWGXW repeat-containing protein [Massilia cavernae]RJG19195.1 hypothetical protein D3872_08825 [Massilia cavernae]